MNPTTTRQKNKEIFDFVYTLPEVAKKQNWVSRYDPESDEFSVTVPKLSKDARIHYVNDELALYYSKNKIEGVFIEYFSKNFVKHQQYKDVKELAKEVNKKKYEGLVEFTWNKLMTIAPQLSEAIKTALVKDIQLQP